MMDTAGVAGTAFKGKLADGARLDDRLKHNGAFTTLIFAYTESPETGVAKLYVDVVSPLT